MESALNTRLLKALRKHHAFRVENSCLAGTPDIAYAGGWIESKWLERWPRKGEIVQVRHFTAQQRCWHVQHSLAGGHSYIVIQIEREVLLLGGYEAAMYLGKVAEDELRGHSLGIWDGKLNEAELLSILWKG